MSESSDSDPARPRKRHPAARERPAPAAAAESSDQAPGEEVVQVNDAYDGGGPPPVEHAPNQDEQHPTGG